MVSGERNLKTIAFTPHIHCRIPNEWTETAGGGGIAFRTPDGGVVTATAREFQKPVHLGMGSGMTSEQMLLAQVAEFGQVPLLVAPGRAYVSHSMPIGEPGREVECRVWHLVNQAGPWHYETVMVSYEPPNGRVDASVVAVLDIEVPRCEFTRSLTHGATESDVAPGKSRPRWRFW